MPPTTDAFADFARQANDTVGSYRLEFTLSPKTLRSANYCIANLAWHSVRFDPAEFKKLPKDKRGVYAFVLCEPNSVLPQHGYVAYIGIAGRDSNRSLRDRCRDYLNDRKLVKTRQGIAFLIGNWRDILHVFYAPVDAAVSAQTLKQLEEELNGALQPPYSRGDVQATIKNFQKAFP
ncbi:hypothetical protein ASD53_05975 [Lysobacter sp. Root559]|uniref:hypothetical protein n=1 Tax=Lysobacter sp. Root559 TaxID=1736559 RepID=UPI0006F9F10B|nr:hypothetical protein [Lysobacter sp. Root559]KQZ59125.1 hypothetical protein ASD53_05975 [Lysobacter sp. Root559]